jgi:rod shape-determining protein MreD
MALKFLIPFLIFIPLAALQIVVVPFITVQNISPNLIVVLLVFYTLKNGQMFGTLLGFLLGFILDLISGGILGAYMFSFTIGAFITGYFFNENKFDINISSFFFTIIVFICASVTLFLYSSVANKNDDVKMIYQIVEDGILPGVYTALFSIPIVIFNPKKGME